MKNDELVKELHQIANGQSQLNDIEKLQRGKSYCFTGIPKKTDKGTIGIVTKTGAEIIFNENDIIEIEKNNNDTYSLEVKEGSNVIVRYELLTKISLKSENCSCNHSTLVSRIQKRESSPFEDFGNGIDFNSPPIIISPCRLTPATAEVICEPVYKNNRIVGFDCDIRYIPPKWDCDSPFSTNPVV